MRNSVDEKLRKIVREGAGLAWLAHITSFALVLAFSAGSLVALAGDALTRFLGEWRAGVIDVPQLISFTVSFLLVVCMDVALIVAAGNVRMLRQRRQPGESGHVLVIIGVSAVEAATYLYMSWRYDAPAAWFAWLLIAARSIAAPLTAVYLSLARVLPIGARDILYQVELVTARGVIGDMTQIASDPTATTERKLALYQASAIMAPEDAARLDGLIAAARSEAPGSPTENISAERAIEQVRRDLHLTDYPPNLETSTGDNEPESPEPPDGGGSPSLASKPSAGNVTPLRRTRREVSRANARSGRRGTAEQRVRAALASDPAISHAALVRRTRLSSSTVSKWLRVIEAERSAEQPGAGRAG